MFGREVGDMCPRLVEKGGSDGRNNVLSIINETVGINNPPPNLQINDV